MADKQQVLSLLQGNRLHEAKTLCTALCARNRNDPESWFLLAGIHAQLGAMEEVIRCCRRVIALDPGNTAARYNLGVALQARSRSEEAAESYRKVLEVEPDNVLAQANLGLVLRGLGSPEEAMQHCRRALQRQPDLIEAHNTLGLLFKDTTRTDQAITCFQRAIALRPQYAEAHYNLGLCHQALGSFKEAEACFRNAIHWRPRYAEAHGRLARALASMGKLEEAVLSYQHLVGITPDSAEAHRDLGVLLASLCKWDDAISHFRRAIQLKSDFADAYGDLGNALLDQSPDPKHVAEAVECFQHALFHKPDVPDVQLRLAIGLADVGRYQEAEANYRRVLVLKPDNPLAKAGLANVLEHRGEFDASYALVKPLVDAGTDNIYVALSYASLAGRFDCRVQAVALLEGILQGQLNDKQQVHAHFMLGKLYDELQQYSKAFEHYRQGNILEAKEFDEQENQGNFGMLIAAFASERVHHRPRASNRSKLPVFIVGMPRSGTTLVEQILSSHPLVHGAGELTDINDIVFSLQSELSASNPYPQCVDDLNRRNIDLIAQKYLDRLGRLARDAVRVTDKMPHNFISVGMIDMLFPAARIIHCVRDPIDTCLSIYFQHFNYLFNTNHPYVHDLGDLAKYYRQYRRLMAHWKTVLRVPMMEVQYEHLVENQEAVTRSLIEFCELDWDDRCLRFHETGRFVKTVSYDQVRRPLYRKSVARWKHYEPFIGPLIAALQDLDGRQD